MNACNNEDCANNDMDHASSGHLVFAHAAYSYHCTVLVPFTLVCLQCIWVPGMCPENRWIYNPAPRSPSDSFVMAGPIRHCFLRAWVKCMYVCIWVSDSDSVNLDNNAEAW